MGKWGKGLLLFVIVASLVLGSGAPRTWAFPGQYLIVRVEIRDASDVTILSSLGAIWEVHDDYLIADVTEEELELIRQEGYEVQVLYRSTEEFLAAYGKPLVYGGEAGLFHSYAEVEQELHDMAAAYPEVAKVYDIGDSHEGREIWALKISDNVEKDEKREPDILFLGGIHAREWIAVEPPMYLAHFLVENYDTDPQVKDLVDNGEIWIVPMVNPDGHQYSITVDRMWRKNRRYNGISGCYGVDLNRNFGYKWGEAGTSSNPCSDIYRGPSPFSEPEIQAIRDLGLEQRFNIAITYHSYGEIIYYPWAYTNNPAPDEPTLADLAGDMAVAISAVRGKDYEVSQCPLAAGSSDDWVYGLFGVPSFGIEMDTTFLTPESEIIPVWEDQKPVCLLLIEWAETFPVRLKPRADSVISGERIRYKMIVWNNTDEDRDVQVVRETKDQDGNTKDTKTRDMTLLAHSRKRRIFKCKAKENMPPGPYTHRVGIYDAATQRLLGRESFDFTVGEP
jgi:hypothetical protein